EEFGRC
nr:Chain P, EEFGRC peptide [synthetic construct]